MQPSDGTTNKTLDTALSQSVSVSPQSGGMETQESIVTACSVRKPIVLESSLSGSFPSLQPRDLSVPCGQSGPVLGSFAKVISFLEKVSESKCYFNCFVEDASKFITGIPAVR